MALALEASANGDYKVTHHDSNGNATKLKGQDVTSPKGKEYAPIQVYDAIKKVSPIFRECKVLESVMSRNIYQIKIWHNF